MRRREPARGQALIEFALVLPVVILLVVSVGELGLALGNKHTIGYGSREGARVGSALASGDVSDCVGGNDPAGVDLAIIGAVQRILKSPGSGIDVSKVEEIRIFKADTNGNEMPGLVNVWAYAGEQAGPDVDPGPGAIKLDFTIATTPGWPACTRDNSSDPPDSVGVTVAYRYDFVTPLPEMLAAISGGAITVTMEETTVMALNPSL